MSTKSNLTINQKKVLDNVADRLRALCNVETNTAIDSYLLAQKIGYSVFKSKKGRKTELVLVEPDSSESSFNTVFVSPDDNPNKIRTNIAQKIAHYLVFQAESGASNKTAVPKTDLEEYSNYLASSILLPKTEVEELYLNLVGQLGNKKAIDVVSDKYGVDSLYVENRIKNLGVLKPNVL